MSKEMATPTVQIDNNHLRVTEWRFAPGAATGYHRHEHDYVVVPTRDGELKLIGPQGEISFAQLQQGKSYFRNAGVEHDVIRDALDTIIDQSCRTVASTIFPNSLWLPAAQDDAQLLYDRYAKVWPRVSCSTGIFRARARSSSFTSPGDFTSRPIHNRPTRKFSRTASRPPR